MKNTAKLWKIAIFVIVVALGISVASYALIAATTNDSAATASFNTSSDAPCSDAQISADEKTDCSEKESYSEKKSYGECPKGKGDKEGHKDKGDKECDKDKGDKDCPEK